MKMHFVQHIFSVLVLKQIITNIRILQPSDDARLKGLYHVGASAIARPWCIASAEAPYGRPWLHRM